MTVQDKVHLDMNDRSTPLILALDNPIATLELVGGKGASLARLAAAGLPVPPGFHVTTAAYRRFVAEHGLQAQILAAVAGIAPDQPAALEAASQQISKLFARHPMPEEIAEAICSAYAALGAGDLAVAVRSSATAEDLPEMSFAGQQETYLNMRGEAMVLDAVRRCWASLWTARAIGYRARHGIAPEDVGLAVVVQELVDADAAGILFTANPLTGARDQVMVNAAWGLGEAIVGGQVTPDTIVVNKTDGAIVSQEISEKQVMTVRTAEGTHEQPVPAERRTQAALSPAQAAELARNGVRIEALYGQPMDIEWALHDGRIAVVQARPITALPKPAAGAQARPASEWALPKPNGRYMRSSVFELLPDPLSPLFATLGLPAWDRATTAIARDFGVAGMFDGMLTTVNGYGYYDVSFTPAQTTKMALSMPRVLVSILPRLMRTARQRWQAARVNSAAVVDRWQAAGLANTSAVQLLDGARELTAEAAQYYLVVQSGILPGAYMSEALFMMVYDKFLKHNDDPAALTFVLGFDSAPILAEKSLYDLAQWVRGQTDIAAGLATMSGEQFTTLYDEQAESGVADGMWPEFWRRLDDHLARFGHTIYDLDFAKPVLADDPLPVLETLKFFLSDQAPNPYQRQAAAESERQQATQTMLARLRGVRLRLFRRLVDIAQGFAPLREDALADVGLGWPVLRRMLREVGRRLVANDVIAAPDDVFWLKWDELRATAPTLDAGQYLGDYRALVARRRATWERQRAQMPPVALPLKDGARMFGIDFSSVMPARTDQPAGDVLKGIGASPGRVTGAARVIHGPDEFAQMRPGDILVARITTPAWTPLFALAAGVVTDVGGPLSHSSIVAREYHIPAVLGTGAATDRLSSGERITVDGDAGTVTAVS
jgi:pyruvate,water dikinase